MSNATSFGRQADAYRRGRPGYPDALFDWIAQQSPGRACVWDVATGSGQAARSLAERFDRVEATDIDAAQIAAATPHPKATYRVAPAETSGLPDASANAVSVATAVHWFAGAPFWAEVARVARPGALFCAWTYKLPRLLDAGLHAQWLDPLYRRLDPFWAEGNRLAMRGYSAGRLHCPFPALEAPNMTVDEDWSTERLADFAESWSAHLRARDSGEAEVLAAWRDRFLDQNADADLAISLPFSVFAARIG